MFSVSRWGVAKGFKKPSRQHEAASSLDSYLRGRSSNILRSGKKLNGDSSRFNTTLMIRDWISDPHRISSSPT